MTEWSLPDVLDVVTDVVPDREMIVWGSTRRSYREVRGRTRRLAAFLLAHGLGVRQERSELEPWQCGQSPVAIVLSNCPEYLEAMIASYRARAVPFNVNHHYRAGEVQDLLDQLGAEAVVYHRRFGALVAQSGPSTRLLIDVDDGSGVAPLPGSVAFEDAVAAGVQVDELPEPSPDDLYMVCTGGTTGAPKGVLWRQADIYVGGMAGSDEATTESIAALAELGLGTFFAAPPLMHGAAQWTAFSGFHGGATVVLHDDAVRFDARTILDIAEGEQVTVMSIVGDAFARPLLDELRARPHALSSLAILGTGGAAMNPASKHELLELLPHVTIMDGYGASETGAAGFAASTKDHETREFAPSAGSTIVAADLSRVLRPDEHDVGWAARTGHIPLGYLHDPDKTARTFPVIEGRRVSIPGDRAHYDAEGRIVMLGRDSMVVNTGGEKVFVEEVEEALRRHPGIVDALVVGRPEERLGEEVVALVQLRPGARLSPAEVREHVGGHLARFKAPRAVLVCEAIGRFPTGKPDYTWARTAAADAAPATGS